MRPCTTDHIKHRAAEVHYAHIYYVIWSEFSQRTHTLNGQNVVNIIDITFWFVAVPGELYTHTQHAHRENTAVWGDERRPVRECDFYLIVCNYMCVCVCVADGIIRWVVTVARIIGADIRC